MDLRLDGKRALVTGSTAGIGYAIAEGLAQEGAEVIVNGRSAERVVEAVGAINHTTSTRAIGIAADLGSADGVTRLVKEVGRVDILVNNVGVFAPVPFTDISDEAWQEIFDINVMSGVRLSRALVHGMVERKWGRIIFISSEVRRPDPGGDGALRRYQDGATRIVARYRRKRGGYRRHGECCTSRANSVRRR